MKIEKNTAVKKQYRLLWKIYNVKRKNKRIYLFVLNMMIVRFNPNFKNNFSCSYFELINTVARSNLSENTIDKIALRLRKKVMKNILSSPEYRREKKIRDLKNANFLTN